jgi:hypothetical protein
MMPQQKEQTKMAKSFRRFREEQYDDEWGDGSEFQSKEDRLKERKMKQRQKNLDKFSFDEEKNDE